MRGHVILATRTGDFISIPKDKKKWAELTIFFEVTILTYVFFT